MAYIKVHAPTVVYHLTTTANAEKILSDKCVKRFADTECWFCKSLQEMLIYMSMTVMNEGKAYYGVGGNLCHYPKFVPSDYVILVMPIDDCPDRWYIWNQELPIGASKDLKKQAKYFSGLKIGYRGDLHFENADVIHLTDILDKLEQVKKFIY